MKTSFTQGQWKQYGRTVYAGKVPVSLAISTFDAECPPVYANDWRNELIGDDEAEANARLIAAAPAMFALIEQFGRTVTDMFEQMEKCDWKDDLGHLASMNSTMIALKRPVLDAIALRAAIKSATQE